MVNGKQLKAIKGICTNMGSFEEEMYQFIINVASKI